MYAPKSCPIARARAHPRKRTMRSGRRRRTPVWPALLGAASVGVILITAAVVLRHRLHRNHFALKTEVAAASAPAAPHSPPLSPPTPVPPRPPASPEGMRPTRIGLSTAASLVSASTQFGAQRNREPTAMIGSFKYRKAPPGVDELTSQLASIREIGLERSPDDPLLNETIRNDRGHTDGSRQFHPYAMVMPEVHSLPLHMGPDCHLPEWSAVALQTYSRRLREHLAGSNSPRALREKLAADGDRTWQAPAAVPTLVQMLQAEGDGLRLLLVQLLARISGPEASRALAGRAVFDVSAEVRHAAVRALHERRKSDFRDVLLRALRHPWPEAADFAAAALVGLRDRAAVPALVGLLDEPSPAAPFAVSEGGQPKYYARELVRINHLRNCIVCHAVSSDVSHLVRASVPDPAAPLPPAFTPAYYRSAPGRLMVRADVTYLRQDFSMPQPVDDHGIWPVHQRYDYCVRTRQLTTDEWEELRLKAAPNPQRESVLFALRELTGEDFGETGTDWRLMLDPRQ